MTANKSSTYLDEMASLTIASKANQAFTLPALLVVTYANAEDQTLAITIEFDEVNTLESGDGASVELILNNAPPIYGSELVIEKFLAAYPFEKHASLVRYCIQTDTARLIITDQQLKEWLARAAKFVSTDFKSVEGPLLELDSHLALRSYLSGYSLTMADLIIWGAIRGNKAAHAAIKKGSMSNISRWFRFIEETNPFIPRAVQSLNAQAQEKKFAKSKEGASYDIALLDTEKGVVTRFPPEPS